MTKNPKEPFLLRMFCQLAEHISTTVGLNKVGCNDPSITYPVGNYMFKFNNRNTRTRCEKCSKLQ